MPRAPAALSSVVASSSILSALRQVRHNSTNPAPLPSAPSAEPTVPEPANFPDDVSLLNLSGNDLLNMQEHIGFLKEMGLDFGFGPTSLMQWLLEHCYIWTGLPWWGAIALTAVVVRAAIFVPALWASDTSQKLAELKKNARYLEATERFKAAAFSGGSRTDMLTARRDILLIEKAEGINKMVMVVPFLNMIIIFSAVKLLRAMAALPVPSLENGGILWIQDLTIGDPFFLMPMLGGLIMYASVRIGYPYMTSRQKRVGNLAMSIMIPLGVIVAIQFCAGLQLFILVSSLLQYLQSRIFFQPTLRNWLGLRPLRPMSNPSAAAAAPGPFINATPGRTTWQPPRTITMVKGTWTSTQPAPPKPEEPQKETIIELVKSGLNDVMGRSGKYMEKRLAQQKMQAELDKARKYEERRAAEEEEACRARMERKRRGRDNGPE